MVEEITATSELQLTELQELAKMLYATTIKDVQRIDSIATRLRELIGHSKDIELVGSAFVAGEAESVNIQRNLNEALKVIAGQQKIIHDVLVSIKRISSNAIDRATMSRLNEVVEKVQKQIEDFIK
ncbi:MAG: hypothetical protein AB1394_07905 [Bacteroidota bacterium]